MEDETESDTNLVCLNEKSKAFIYKNSEDGLDEDDASSFIKKFLEGTHVQKEKIRIVFLFDLFLV